MLFFFLFFFNNKPDSWHSSTWTDVHSVLQSHSPVIIVFFLRDERVSRATCHVLIVIRSVIIVPSSRGENSSRGAHWEAQCAGSRGSRRLTRELHQQSHHPLCGRRPLSRGTGFYARHIRVPIVSSGANKIVPPAGEACWEINFI